MTPEDCADDYEMTIDEDEPAGVIPDDTERLYVRVLRHIEQEVLSGRMQPGDKLPAERELSERLQVSRGSTREALRVLEAMDIVRVNARNGRGSGSVLTEASGDAMREILRLSVAFGHFSVADVVDARIAMESWVVRRVAAQHSVLELEPLVVLLEAMRQKPINRTTFVELDTEYHLAIARMSGSDLITHLMEGLRSAIKQWMITGAEYVSDWRTMSSRVNDEHQEIYLSIKSGDGDRAARAIERHLLGFYQAVRNGQPR
jgi:DNA-binding FadR family transcriptional regulator